MESWAVFLVAVAIALAASYRAVLRLSPIHPLPLLLPPPVSLTGPFAPNSLLRSHLHRIGDGLLPSPEDVVSDAHGFLFVGCSDGWIKRVDPLSNSVENWVFLGAGRSPLGLTLGRHGELIVCDADKGLLNVTKENVEVLSQEAEGVQFMARCQRYWLKGEKKGLSEIFIDRLPGFPDNIKNDGKGQFWISLVAARPFYFSWALQYPFLKQLAEVLGLSDVLIKRMFKRALALAVTEEGEPLRTLADPAGDAIHMVTTAYVVGDDLYLGSLGVNFLGHVKLKEAN